MTPRVFSTGLSLALGAGIRFLVGLGFRVLEGRSPEPVAWDYTREHLAVDVCLQVAVLSVP